MLALIILIVFGLLTAFFATQNTGGVNISLGNYSVSGIPLYAVVVGSILLGVFISFLISIVNSLSSSLTLHNRDNAIKNANKTIESLRKENEALKIENTKISERANVTVLENENKNLRPSIFQKAKQSLA